MKRLIAFIFSTILVVTGLAMAANRPAATVNMTDSLQFSPARITIKIGETVEWRNTSQVVHTVTADPQKAADPSHVKLPPKATPFNSGEISPGGTYQHTFPVAGAYRYFCIPHEAMGMIGEIEVQP